MTAEQCEPSQLPAAAEEDDDCGTPMWLGIIGLVAGLGGLALGVPAYAGTRAAGPVSTDT